MLKKIMKYYLELLKKIVVVISRVLSLKKFSFYTNILKKKLIYFSQKKQSFFTFILKDRYYIGSFFVIFFISFTFHYYDCLESIILITKMFLFTIGYLIYIFIQLLLVPIYIMYVFKLYGIDFSKNPVKFLITKAVVIILIRLFLFYYLGLSWYTNVLFLDLDLLSLFDYKILISKCTNRFDQFIRCFIPNSILNENSVESTRFNTIISPLDKHESFRKSKSPGPSSPVNRNMYYNSPSPSSQLSIVNPVRLGSPRSLSPPVSSVMSPLFGSWSLHDPFSGSSPPLLNASPIPLSSTSHLNRSPTGLSPIPDLGSPLRSPAIAQWFADEYVTNEYLRKGIFNPEYNTIDSSKIESKKSLLSLVLPNFKLVGLYYIDPSSSKSFTFFNFILINHFEVKSVYIPEIGRYYDPMRGIWWDESKKIWIDSKIMYGDNHDLIDFEKGIFTKDGQDNLTSYFLNQKLKKLEYGSAVMEEIKKINSRNIGLLNLSGYIEFDKLNATRQEMENHFLSLDEKKMKTHFLRLFKSGDTCRADYVVNILENRFLNNNNVPVEIKHHTNSLILQLLAQRAQIMMLEDYVGSKFLLFSDKYTWIKPSEYMIKENKSKIVFSLPSE